MDFGGLFLLLAVGLVVGVLLMSAYTAWVITHPPRRNYAWAVSRGLPGDPGELASVRPDRPAPPFEEWSFPSRGRDLPTWDIPGDNPAGPIVAVTHGWGDSRVVSLRCVPALLPVASRIVLWDCPGHGDAPGWCGLGTREVGDLGALLDQIAADRSGTPVVLYGFSMGAGISIACAAARAGEQPPIAGVIAEAAYRRPVDPARNVLRLADLPHTLTLRLALMVVGVLLGRGPAWATRARGFDRVELARRLKTERGPVPLLVLHGTEDPVCPIGDGREIAAAAPAGELVEVEGAAHNNLWTEDKLAGQSAEAVQSFLRKLGVTPV